MRICKTHFSVLLVATRQEETRSEARLVIRMNVMRVRERLCNVIQECGLLQISHFSLSTGENYSNYSISIKLINIRLDRTGWTPSIM